MPDHRDVLERGLHEFRSPELPYEAILQRRDRHRRNQRIAAAVVGLGIGIAAILVGASLIRADKATPANPEPPLKHNGMIALVGGWGTASRPGTGGMFLIDPRTGSRSELTVCPECEPIDSFEDLRWSSDGATISFTTCRRGCAYGHVSVFDLATNQTSRIATCKRSQEHPAICNGRLERSPDGSRIALGESERLVLVDPDGTNRTTLADFGYDQGYVGRPAWSPDGATIAISVQLYGGAQALSRLYLVDADGSNLRIILERQGDEGVRDPEWSPDGSRLAYMAFTPLKPAGGIPQVWVVDVDGSDLSRLFVAGGCCTGYTTGLTWAPDGTEIAFVGRTPGGRIGAPRLYLIDPDGGGVRVLARDVPFGRPAWQPVP